MKELPKNILRTKFKIGNLDCFSNDDIAWASELVSGLINTVFNSAVGLDGAKMSFKARVSIKMQYAERVEAGPIECFIITVKNTKKKKLLRKPIVSQYPPFSSDFSGPSFATPILVWVSVELYSPPEALETEKALGLNTITKNVVDCIMNAMKDREDRPTRIGNYVVKDVIFDLPKKKHHKKEDNVEDKNSDGGTNNNANGGANNDGASDTKKPDDPEKPDIPDDSEYTDDSP